MGPACRTNPMTPVRRHAADRAARGDGGRSGPGIALLPRS